MALKVYVIRDRGAIEFIENDDIEGFKGYLEEESTLDFGESEGFETEAEAMAFCAGLGYGVDERGVTAVYPLRSTEESDLEFIAAIEEYV